MGWGRQQEPQYPQGQQQWDQGQAQQQPAFQQWEYKVLSEPPGAVMEMQLNQLGAEGWRLVSIDPNPSFRVAKGSVYVFMRPKA